MKHSQLNFVRDQLLQHGKVSRNLCLQNRISRLSGRILDLKHEGWSITGKNVKENGGTNYYYYLIDRPKELKRTVRILDGKAYITETYE